MDSLVYRIVYSIDITFIVPGVFGSCCLRLHFFFLVGLSKLAHQLKLYILPDELHHFIKVAIQLQTARKLPDLLLLHNSLIVVQSTLMHKNGNGHLSINLLPDQSHRIDPC